jgi:hypothetical protein
MTLPDIDAICQRNLPGVSTVSYRWSDSEPYSSAELSGGCMQIVFD